MGSQPKVIDILIQYKGELRIYHLLLLKHISKLFQNSSCNYEAKFKDNSEIKVSYAKIRFD